MQPASPFTKSLTSPATKWLTGDEENAIGLAAAIDMEQRVLSRQAADPVHAAGRHTEPEQKRLDASATARAVLERTWRESIADRDAALLAVRRAEDAVGRYGDGPGTARALKAAEAVYQAAAKAERAAYADLETATSRHAELEATIGAAARLRMIRTQNKLNEAADREAGVQAKRAAERQRDAAIALEARIAKVSK